MAYDPSAESLKLIDEGAPDVELRLTRRRRFVPVAVDVVDDVAATLFLRRGVSGNPWLEAWTLERRGEEWHRLGGGGSDGHDELMEPRASVDGLVRRLGTGWTARGGGGLLPWPRRGISHAEMRLGPAVAALQVGDRHVSVASHGVAIVVWKTKKPPQIRVLDNAGIELTSLRPGDRHW